MATKTDILNNLREYTVDELVEAIKAGTVTVYELSKSGNLTPLMRRRIESCLAAKPTETSQSAFNIGAGIKDSSSFNFDEKTSEDIDIPDVVDTEIPESVTTVVTDAPTFDNATQEFSSSSSSSEKSNKGMFKRPFSFYGRIRRTEFGISYIIYMIWYGIINVFMEMPDTSEVVAVFVLISFIPMFWFLCAQSTKRCHDRGNSGWFQLIPFYFLVLLFGGSEEGSNKYGDNPKE